MVRRRLLMAGGTGLFSGIPSPSAASTTFEILSSGGAIGITKVTPAGYYYNGKVYFGFAANNTEVQVAQYVIASMTTSTPFVIGSAGGESHAAPSIVVRTSDHKLFTAFAFHDAANLYVRTSTNAEDATAWGSAVDIDGSLGGSDYTYCTLVQLAGESGKLYLFYRDIVGGIGRIAYSTSTDAGATWAAATILATASGAGQVLYFRVGSDWDTRIDILTTDNDRVVTASALYHLYYETGAWHKSDGTVISASQPFAPSAGTLVKSNADGALDPAGVSLSSANVPGGVFVAYQSGTTSNKVWTCRYRSGAWQNDMIADTNGIISSNRFVGGAACLEDLPDRVWFPKKVGSKFELHEATTNTDGVTWAVTALETGSSTDAMLPTPIHDGIGGARCLYSKGTWTSDSSFSLSIRGVT